MTMTSTIRGHKSAFNDIDEGICGVGVTFSNPTCPMQLRASLALQYGFKTIAAPHRRTRAWGYGDQNQPLDSGRSAAHCPLTGTAAAGAPAGRGAGRPGA